jgi:AraC family transcriptional regulator, regulatory protein of adaptative response / methylphosphotriester-DNA alkyltransferase methyltransferase
MPGLRTDLSITRAPLEGGTLLALRGRVDVPSACRVETALRDAAAAGEPLTIDLTSVEVDSVAGSTLLLNAIRRVHGMRPDTRVVCPPGPFRAALERTALTRRIEVLDQFDEVPGAPPEPVVPAASAARPPTTRRRSALLAHATVAIEARYADPDLGLEHVARRVATSSRQLQRVFAELAGTTFRAELNAVRMQHAAELLQATDLPVGAIARRVGHRQPAQFAHAFRRHHGIAPTELRRGARR